MKNKLLSINDHLLSAATYHASPHFDDRTHDNIELIVIHNISLPEREFGGEHVINFFTGQLDISSHPFFKQIAHLRVSAHLFIRRTGQIIQFVPFNKRAWHAGVSNYKGRDCCNDFSIGIEMEGCDDIAYTPEQYDSLAQVTHSLFSVYPLLHKDKIVGHSDIAPERKTDPGKSFDWDSYHDLLKVLAGDIG